MDLPFQIDLMHNDVTLPKGNMVVVVTLKPKMAAVSTRSGGYSKSIGFMIHLKAPTNRPSHYIIDGPVTSEHMSALLPLKFSAPGKYDAILNSYVTTTTIMHVRPAKALFYVIMHKVYCIYLSCMH